MFRLDQVPGILLAYMAGIKVALGVAVGAVGISVIISLLSRWGKINTDAMKGGGAA
jgi:MFS transporter, DHA2 family, glioxin efflux transporter